MLAPRGPVWATVALAGRGPHPAKSVQGGRDRPWDAVIKVHMRMHRRRCLRPGAGRARPIGETLAN